ncbi:hypothetical protein EDC04DRAFT_214818 [Pisolithus marmoratus]|nr:hypothetical protein EDC04DRAFT_214818 [Pisolithus marmoratus]
MKSLRQCCGAGHSGQQRGNSHASGVPPFPVPSATAICMALIFKTLPFERRIRDIGHFRIWRFFTCVARKASGLTECDVQQCDFNSNEPVYQWNSQLRRTQVTNLYGIRLPHQGSLLALPQGGVCLHLLGTPCPHTVHNYKIRDPRYPGPSQTQQESPHPWYVSERRFWPSPSTYVFPRARLHGPRQIQRSFTSFPGRPAWPDRVRCELVLKWIRTTEKEEKCVFGSSALTRQPNEALDGCTC